MKARVLGLMGGEPGSRQVSLVQTRAHKHAEQGAWVQTKLLGRGRGPWRRKGVPGVQSRALKRRQVCWLWVRAPTNTAGNPAGAELGSGAQPRSWGEQS